MKLEKINFKNNKGQNLVGNLYSPDNSDNSKVAIFCHGYRSTKETSKAEPLSKELMKEGISLFVFDFSGCGESDGKFEDSTITQYIDDVKSAINQFPDSEIAVIGSSLGGIITLQEAANDERVKVLVELAPVSTWPPSSNDEFGRVEEWKEKGFAMTDSKRLGKMRINYEFYEDGLQYADYSVYERIKAKTLILHGTADESVNINQSKELEKHLENGKLIILDGENHGFTKDFNRMVEEISKFVIENL